jgi:hypothetical protein
MNQCTGRKQFDHMDFELEKKKQEKYAINTLFVCFKKGLKFFRLCQVREAQEVSNTQ